MTRAKDIHLAIIAGEANHFILHTGLASIVRDLGRAVRGDETVRNVCLVLPYFAAVDAHFRRHGGIFGPVERFEESFIWRGQLDDGALPIWLIDAGPAFNRMRNGEGGDRIVWTDELGRRGRFRNSDMATAMLAFNRVAARWLMSRSTNRPWKPTVVHCMNWEGALVPRLLAETDGEKPKTVLGIDLLTYQGIVIPKHLNNLSDIAPRPKYNPQSGLNFMAEGIRKADVLHLPNDDWAQRICDPSQSFGEGLQGLIRRHQKKIRTAPYAINPGTFSWDQALTAKEAPPKIRKSTPVEKLRWLQHRLRDDLGLDHLEGPIFLVGNRLSENDQKNYRAVSVAMRRILSNNPQAQLVLRLFPPPHPRDAKMSRMWRTLELLERDFPKRAVVNPTHPYKGRTIESWLFLLLGADVTLMPSRFEPAGLNHLQALHCGCPVIGTARGGIAQTIQHGKNGWLFADPRDDNELTRLCQKAVDLYGTGRWQRMVRAAINTPVSWQSKLPQYIGMYR